MQAVELPDCSWQNIHAVEIEASGFLKNPDESCMHCMWPCATAACIRLPCLRWS